MKWLHFSSVNIHQCRRLMATFSSVKYWSFLVMANNYIHFYSIFTKKSAFSEIFFFLLQSHSKIFISDWSNFIFFSIFTKKSAFSEIFFFLLQSHSKIFIFDWSNFIFFPNFTKNLHFLRYFYFYSNLTLKFLSSIGVILYSFLIS
jgi:hypothetical protein